MKNKQLWLISDRTDKANDNGEHMFRYINHCAPNDIEAFYVIEKSSPDFKNMKKIGKVLPYNTPKYRTAFLLADKIVASSGGDYLPL